MSNENLNELFTTTPEEINSEMKAIISNVDDLSLRAIKLDLKQRKDCMEKDGLFILCSEYIDKKGENTQSKTSFIGSEFNLLKFIAMKMILDNDFNTKLMAMLVAVSKTISEDENFVGFNNLTK